MVVPPAAAETSSCPLSASYETLSVPSGCCVTFVTNAVPRTAAVEVGVFTSNFESAVFSFCTEAQVRPRLCSIVTWMPPPSSRFSVVTFTTEPGSTVSDEPSKNVRTARPFCELFTMSPVL